MTNLSNGQSPQNSTTSDVYTLATSSVGWRTYPLDIAIARGNDRLDLLQRMTTNDVLKLSGSDTSGNGAQNVLVTDKARIIDVFTVLARENDALMLFSYGLGEKALQWLEKYTFIDDFETKDVSAEYASYLVFGARSLQLLEELTGASLLDMRQSAWQKVSIAGSAEGMIIKQQPLCGFCHIVLVPKAHEEALCSILRGLEDVAEVDDATFETLRIESAWGKHGAEWTDERNPLEAGLVGLVDFKKGCYIGQEVIARLDTYNKVKVRLSGFVSNALIPANTQFFDIADDGKRTNIGAVSSTTFSPELGQYIALGYIRSQFANPGATAHGISTNGDGAESAQTLEIVKLPFVM